MSHTYTAQVVWARHDSEAFTDHRYHREHRLRFDGGVEIAGSSSPSVVPVPCSNAEAVDPEEMFVASLAACHMLWFLSLAAKAGVVVDRYADDAGGVMTKNEHGKFWMSHVTLKPRITSTASAAQIAALHHRAHEECFIANSVKTVVTVVPAA